MSKITECKCHSYNGGFGTAKGVVLKMPIQSKPEGMDWQVEYRDVSIDACISKVIQRLWDNNISTLGSCCGHNGLFGFPSIVLGQHEENYSHIRQIISQVDNRHFELSQWKRILV